MNFIHQVEPYITENEIKSVTEYLSSGGWLTEFKKTEEFEQMLSDFLGAKYSVVLTSGTVALYLSLLAMGLKEGDKVIVPNYTMIATVNAVKWASAEPVLVDVNPTNLCMDIGKIEVDLSCKALIYVSINGRGGNMDEVVRFCKRNNLVLIEDACQSLGSKWNNKYLGTFGNVGIFSFTPHKIVTTGQGGAVVTNDEELYRKIKKLKDFHRTAPATDWHDGLGFNFKFTDLQAVIGIEQMKTIDYRIKKKKEIYQRCREKLNDSKEVNFLPINLDETTPWFVDILLPNGELRDNLITYLKKNNIGSRPFYPPINHQPLYSSFERGSFPISESMAYRGLWLPSSVGISEYKIDYFCDKIIKFFRIEQ